MDLVYRRCRDPLLAFCRRRIDEATAQDIVHETLLRALAFAPKIDASKPLLPLLRTIAANLCIDYMRRRRNPASIEEMREVELNSQDPPPGRRLGYLAGETVRLSDPDATFDTVDIRLRFEQMISALLDMHPRRRRMIGLRYVAGLPYAAIAQEEGTSESAAKHVVLRARRMLRSLNKDTEQAPPRDQLHRKQLTRDPEAFTPFTKRNNGAGQ
jgi:RNA polymerase sigma factor (sigma-70 family)